MFPASEMGFVTPNRNCTNLLVSTCDLQTSGGAATTVNATAAGLTQKYYVGIWDGLKWNLKHKGVIGGLFRGVGPRVFWTSFQSAIMFVIYEQALRLQENMRYFEQWPYGSS